MARETSLFRNTWLNLLGQGIPLAIAFAVLPQLLVWIGPDRTGVLTTLWVVIGYFALLDLGLGRAVVHLVAERTAAGQRDEVPDYVWPALIIIGALSLGGSFVVAALTPKLVEWLLNVPLGLADETRRAFFAVSLSLPLVTLTSCLRGILEARQKFLAANLLQGLTSGSNALVPLIAAYFTPDLSVMAWCLFSARIVLLFAHLGFAISEFPELSRRPRLSRDKLVRLFRFGSWSTVSNVVGPVMVYLDRLVVGANVVSAAVPIYAIPHEAITRLLILPSALARALFPKMSSLQLEARSDLSKKVVSASTLLIFPLVLVMVYFAEEALTLWLGAEIALQSAPILKVLAIGYFLNAAAHVPFIQMQSQERPDLTAKAHLIELPFYLLLLFYLTAKFGALGAAWAWFLRVAFDTAAMFWMASRLSGNKKKPSQFLQENWGVLAGVLLLAPGIWLFELPLSLGQRSSVALSVLVIFTFVVWRYWFDREIRNWVLLKLGRAT